MAYGGSVTPFVAPPPTVTPTAGCHRHSHAGHRRPTATADPGRRPAGAGGGARRPVLPADRLPRRRPGRLVLPVARRRRHVRLPDLARCSRSWVVRCRCIQRLIIQLCPGAGPQLINLLDPDIFPYTRVNGSVFPTPDDQLKQRTPAVGSPDYANILPFIQTNTPDHVQRPAGELLADVHGPRRPGDPGRADLAAAGRPDQHQLHLHALPAGHPALPPDVGGGTITEPLLLADYLKQIMLGPNAPSLPQDLQQQASGSRFYRPVLPRRHALAVSPGRAGRHGPDVRLRTRLRRESGSGLSVVTDCWSVRTQSRRPCP